MSIKKKNKENEKCFFNIYSPNKIFVESLQESEKYYQCSKIDKKTLYQEKSNK